jgi:hypothetical protein
VKRIAASSAAKEHGEALVALWILAALAQAKSMEVSLRTVERGGGAAAGAACGGGPGDRAP